MGRQGTGGLLESSGARLQLIIQLTVCLSQPQLHEEWFQSRLPGGRVRVVAWVAAADERPPKVSGAEIRQQEGDVAVMERDPSIAANDLLIIGAGALGRRVGRLWLARHPEAGVLAETRSDRAHAGHCEEGMTPRLRSDPDPPAMPHVLFSVPPSSQDDYAAEAARAARLWRRDGRLVITSSTAVYAEEDGGRCVERSALADSPRAWRLREAEDRLLVAGAVVVRLAGLYDHDRGPHRVYLRTRTSPRRPDGLVSLIHYDDAAELCVRAASLGDAGAIYLGCDDHPITRQELVQAVVRSPRYSTAKGPPRACRFTGTEGPLGRRCDSGWTRRALDWKPTYRRFLDWIDDIEEA